MTVLGANRALPYVGQRLASTVCDTNVVVLDPGSSIEAPRCGGAPMRQGARIPCAEPDRPRPESVHTVAGSVYWDETTGMKLRCTRSGSGLLTLHGRAMVAQSPVWALGDRGVEMTHASSDNGERNTVFDLGLAREILSGAHAIFR
jgi:hypothetical protein